MKKILLKLMPVILLLICSCAKQFKYTKNYNQFITFWKEIVPPQFVAQFSSMGQHSEICETKLCDFYYFIYENQTLLKDQNTNKTLLLVSGLYGDQYLGPNLLLNSYQHLNVARIIFFPVANPSGFSKGEKLTIPTNIDIKKDFPFYDNEDCFRSTFSIIMDNIFRKYKIDLTINLQNGDPSILFNWSNKNIQANTHTNDFGIQLGIAQMLKYYGNIESQGKDKQFEFKTLYQAEPQNKFNFEDWAYGASSFNEKVPESCGKIQIKRYPKDTMNGLVFTILIGNEATQQQKLESPEDINNFNQKGQKLISRGIILLGMLTEILNPYIEIKFDKNEVLLQAHGCMKAGVKSFYLINLNNSPLYYSDQQFLINGNIQSGGVEPLRLKLSNKFTPNGIRYEIFYECEAAWRGLGSTVFSQVHSYRQKGELNEAQINLDQNTILSNLSLQNFQSNPIKYIINIIAIIFIMALLICCILNIIKAGINVKKVENNRKKYGWFQKIEYVEDIQIINQSISSKEQNNIYRAQK